MEESLEYILTNHFRKEDMVSFLETHPDQFSRAIDLALGDKQPYAWRATWILGHCMKKNDDRLIAHINAFIKALPAKKDGHQRELLKILLKMELDDVHEGYLFDACMTIWEQVNKSPSVRVTAFRVVLEVAKKYPELNNEIDLYAQNYFTETLSPGIKRSFLKTVNK